MYVCMYVCTIVEVKEIILLHTIVLITGEAHKLAEDDELQGWALELASEGNSGCGIKVNQLCTWSGYNRERMRTTTATSVSSTNISPQLLCFSENIFALVTLLFLFSLNFNCFKEEVAV